MIKFICKLTKSHLTAIVVSIVLGLIIISPHLRMRLEIGDNFKGVYSSFTDDEIYYQARIKEAAEGHFGIGNSYINEHQNDLFIHPPIPEWIFAVLVMVSGFSVPSVTLLGGFIFPAVCFLLLYSIFLKIIKKKNLSVLYSSAFIFLFLQTFARPISPQFNLVVFLFGFYLIYEIYNNVNLSDSNKIILSTFLGFSVGLMFFISPYYWTSLLVLGFLSLLFKLKYDRDWKHIKLVLMGFLPPVSVFISLYAYFTLRASSLSGYIEATERFGLIRTNWPGAYTNIFLGLITALVFFFSRKFIVSKDKYFIACLLISILVLNWQNVFTGVYLQFSSHYLLITILFIFFVIALIQKHIPRLTVSAIALIVVLIFMQRHEVLQTIKYKIDRDSAISIQSKAEVFNWLNKNTEKDSTVYSLGGDYDFLIPVYTHNTVYYNFYATLSILPNEELENRWIIQNIFNSYFTKDYIEARQREFWGNRFIDPYFFIENRKKIISKITGKEHKPAVQISSELIDDMYKRYGAFVSMPVEESLKTYNIDYILLNYSYPSYDSALKQIDSLKFVQRVAQIGDNQIYKVND